MGLSCLGASISQNIILISNYFKYETVQKIDEKKIVGDMYTPEIVFCSDPPNYNESVNVIDGDIKFWSEDNVSLANLTIMKLRTLYKVQVVLLKKGLKCVPIYHV